MCMYLVSSMIVIYTIWYVTIHICGMVGVQSFNNLSLGARRPLHEKRRLTDLKFKSTVLQHYVMNGHNNVKN